MSSSVVGSVGHILRNTFKDLYVAPPAPPAPKAAAPVEAPVVVAAVEEPSKSPRTAAAAATAAKAGGGSAKDKSKEAAAAAPGGAKGKAAAAAAVAAPEAAAAPVPAAAPAATLAASPPPEQAPAVVMAPDDPRLAAELLRIATARDEKLGTAARLRAYLAAATAAAGDADAAEAAALRRLGLVLKSEVPQGPSSLVIDRAALAPYGAFGASLLIAADIVASAGARHETRRAQPFSSTEGVPHYEAPTAAQDVRNKLLATRRAVVQAASQGGVAAAAGPETELPEDEADAAAAPRRAPRRPRGTGGPFNPEQQDQDAKILARMAQASSYLRNPRQAEAVTAAHDGGAPWFVPEPRVLEYSDYAAGVPCPPRTILLRNASALTRSLRVLPAASRYFVIERVVFPTPGLSTVAPGMAASIVVRFTPDALSDFADALTVVTEQGSTEVPVRARRAPPELDLPPVLELGCCLPGDGITRVYVVTNRGATARLKLFAGSEWPPADPARPPPAELDCGAFAVSPTDLTIAGGGAQLPITVRFMPPSNGAYESRFVLVADNLQVFECTCRGSSADLDTALVAVQGTQLLPPAPARGALQVARLRYDPLSVRAVVTKTVTVTNRAPLDATYRWTVVGWNTVGPRRPPPAAKTKSTSRRGPSASVAALLASNATLASMGAATAAANAAPFAVSPPEGVLPPGASASFTFSFAPGEARGYEAVALMHVLDVPTAAAVAAAPDLAERRRHCAALAAGVGDRGEMSARTDLLICSVALSGAGAAGEVSVTPAIVAAPPAFRGGRWTQRLRLTNAGAAPTLVTFGAAVPLALLSTRGVTAGMDAAAAVSVEPPSLPLAPGASGDVTLSYTAPATPGDYALDVPVAVSDGPPLAVRVTGRTRAPRVRIVERELDFGLFVVNGSATAAFTVENEAPVAVEWSAAHLEGAGGRAGPGGGTRSGDGTPGGGTDTTPRSAFDDAASTVGSGVGETPRAPGGPPPPPRPSYCGFRLEPAGGSLPAHGRVTVTVTCTAGDGPHRMREVLTARAVPAAAAAAAGALALDVDDDGGGGVPPPPPPPAASVRCRGEVQTPMAYCSTTAWAAGIVFVGVPVSRTVSLVNLSNLPAPFVWTASPLAASLGAAAAAPPLYAVSFEPASGELGAKEVRDVSITVTPLLPGAFDAPLVCDVRGLPSPLGLSLSGVSRALVIAFAAGTAGVGATTNSTAAAAPPPPPSQQQRGVSVSDAGAGGADDDASLASAVAAAAAAGALPGSVPTLGFGAAFPTFSLKRLTLSLYNLSGIATAVSARVSRYESADAAEVASRGGSGGAGGGGGRAARPLLGREHEATAKFASAAGAAALAAAAEGETMKAMLARAAGVAFGVSPAMAPLPAFGRATITVTCTADMPGRYADDLVLDIPGLHETRVPLRVNVVGSPLVFTDNVAGLSLAGPTPTLTWGQLVVDSPPVPKVFYVRNTAPVGASLSWRVRPPPRSVPQPLVDVSVRVGDDGGVAVGLAPRDDDRPPPPFTITPDTAVVAPRGTTSFTISARPDAVVMSAGPPPPVGQGAGDGSWRGVLVGDATWENGGRASVAALSRSTRSLGQDGAAAVSRGILTLALTSTPVAPSLTLDKRLSPDGRASVKFGVWDTAPESHASYTRQIPLTNAMDATLTFTVSLEGPYKFAGLATSAPRHPLAGDAVRRRPQSAGADVHIFTLPPGYNVVADVTFDKAAARAAGAAAAAAAATAGSSSGGGLLAQVQSRLREEYLGALRISFSNGAVQEVGLRADVLRPMVVAAPPAYDFGTLNVERAAVLELAVGNPTGVDADWSLAHVPAAPPRPRITVADVPGAGGVRDALAPPPREPVIDDPSVFEFGARAGSLPGPTKPLSAAAAGDLRADGGTAPLLLLRVEFKPRANALYRSRFRFHVRCGEGFDVVLSGHGSFDEAHDSSK